MPPFPQSVDDSRNAVTTGCRSPLKFFLLVFALSLPFWLAGIPTTLQVLPGLPVSSLISRMDRLAMPLHSRGASASRVDLQQHGQERFRRDPVPRHGECRYFPISNLRFLLRSAHRRPDHSVRGRTRHSRMGAAIVGSVQNDLTQSALHQPPSLRQSAGTQVPGERSADHLVGDAAHQHPP